MALSYIVTDASYEFHLLPQFLQGSKVCIHIAVLLEGTSPSPPYLIPVTEGVD